MDRGRGGAALRVLQDNLLRLGAARVRAALRGRSPQPAGAVLRDAAEGWSRSWRRATRSQPVCGRTSRSPRPQPTARRSCCSTRRRRCGC
ncbi:MAG: hypothetical protein H6835_01920 [Planctomycetes bacterium]|nr:hypothetical protein [Planctomycetota bacterium]